MNVTASQGFNRLVQLDRAKGLEVRVFDQPSLFHSETELTLSEAAERVNRGETVTLEEVGQTKANVTYTEWGHPKEGVVTITHRTRTHLESGQDLDQFLHLRAGEQPVNDFEALATKLLSMESHVNPKTQEIVGLASVKEGFFGGKSVEDGPGLSAFEAARLLQNRTTIALTGMPVLSMVEALFGGGADHAREDMKVRYLSAPSDVEALVRQN